MYITDSFLIFRLANESWNLYMRSFRNKYFLLLCYPPNNYEILIAEKDDLYIWLTSNIECIKIGNVYFRKVLKCIGLTNNESLFMHIEHTLCIYALMWELCLTFYWQQASDATIFRYQKGYISPSARYCYTKYVKILSIIYRIQMHFQKWMT